jgi:hypothetical protein
VGTPAVCRGSLSTPSTTGGTSYGLAGCSHAEASSGEDPCKEHIRCLPRACSCPHTRAPAVCSDGSSRSHRHYLRSPCESACCQRTRSQTDGNSLGGGGAPPPLPLPLRLPLPPRHLRPLAPSRLDQPPRNRRCRYQRQRRTCFSSRAAIRCGSANRAEQRLPPPTLVNIHPTIGQEVCFRSSPSSWRPWVAALVLCAFLLLDYGGCVNISSP